MKYIKKLLLGISAVAVMFGISCVMPEVFGAFDIQASAAVVNSGTCGDDLTWELDDEKTIYWGII